MYDINSAQMELMAEMPSMQQLQPYPQKCNATILIVEDDPGLRCLLEQCLNKGNYQVVSTSTESDALRLLAEHQIDLILLDLVIPHMRPTNEQLTICQSIRRQYEVFIVALGDLSPLNIKLYVQQLGADAYLSKPMRLTELYSCIQSLLVPCKG